MLPRAKMVNADLARIINSDEVQSVVKPIKKDAKRAVMKKNPLKNLNVMLKLNPYAKTAKRMSLLAEAQRVKAKKEKLTKKRKTVTKVILILHFVLCRCLVGDIILIRYALQLTIVLIWLSVHIVL